VNADVIWRKNIKKGQGNGKNMKEKGRKSKNKENAIIKMIKGLQKRRKVMAKKMNEQ
jgi:ribosomal protein L15E